MIQLQFFLDIMMCTWYIVPSSSKGSSTFISRIEQNYLPKT